MNKSLFVIFLCLLAITWVSAVEKIDLRKNNELIAKAQNVAARQVMSHQELLTTVAGMSQEIALELLKKISDESSRSGLVHYRYRMMYRGVPVWGEHVVLSENGSRMVSRMHGTVLSGIEKDISDVKAAYTAEEALALVKSMHKVTDTKDSVIYRSQSSELVVYVNKDKAQLCYAVSFFADLEKGGKPTRPTYILDAVSKEVVFKFEGLTFNDGTGPGGNTKTGKYQYGKDYPAFEVAFANNTSTMENENVKTVNLNNTEDESLTTPYSYQGTENTFKTINGAYSPINDAHYFGGIVFKMYKDWYNTAPLTFKLMLKVHYSTNYENAFWDGTSMTFGDGKSYFYPLVSLDVVTHEVSHGFTEQNSGLLYSKQSGGINEAFSDIAGEASEYFMKNKNDWMVGADIFKQSGALRYLNNPPLDGESIGSANDYYDGLDVHYSSGVYNKAFYLLSTTSGWNTKKAFDVFIKANQTYWTPSTDFVTGAKGVLDAAKDLGYSTDDVVKAFKGVDIVISAD